MTKYIKKPTFVDAFQWDGSIPDERWPEWVIEANNDGALSFHCRIDEPKVSSGGIYGKEIKLFKYGDWIIRKENGDLWSYSPEEFAANYSPYVELTGAVYV